MEKILGYTEEEAFELAKMAEQAKKNNIKMSAVFEVFALKRGRSKGAVRNFYYEFIKLCEQSPSVGKRYFSSLPSVNKIKVFNEDDERELVKNILLGKQQNKSVRRTIYDLAGGDEKLGLRLQNKYRNILKSNRSLVFDTARQLGMTEELKEKVPDFTLKSLKLAINKMVDDIAKSVRAENEELKKQNGILKREIEFLRSGEIKGEISFSIDPQT